MKKPRRLMASDIAHTTDSALLSYRRGFQKAKAQAATAREAAERQRAGRADPVIFEHLKRWHLRLEMEGKLRTEGQDVTVERIEWALAFLAYLIELDGPVHTPLFEKLERELESLRAREDTVSRAKRLLESYGGRPPLAAIAPPLLALAPPSE